MKDFKLSGNDLVIGQDLVFVDGTDQIEQEATIILNNQLGDFILEPTFGLEMSNIMAKTIYPAFVAQDIQNALVSNSAQIIDIQNIDISQDKATRNLQVAFDIGTKLGNTATEVQISAG